MRAFLLAVTAFLFAGVFAAPASAAEYGSVSGKYVDTQGVPLAQIRIGLVDSKGSQTYVHTDNSGRFSYRQVIPGDYKVRFIWRDETDQWYPGTPYREDAKTLNVYAGEAIWIDETALATGTLNIRITDSVTGLPIPGSCARTRIPPYIRACVNPQGVATFRNLRARTYPFHIGAPSGYEDGLLEGVIVRPGETTNTETTLTPEP